MDRLENQREQRSDDRREDLPGDEQAGELEHRRVTQLSQLQGGAGGDEQTDDGAASRSEAESLAWSTR